MARSSGRYGVAMTKRSFFVRACWDPEARVYFSESDICGLHVETETLEEFEALLIEFAPALAVENHLSDVDLSSQNLAAIIPAIL